MNEEFEAPKLSSIVKQLEQYSSQCISLERNIGRYTKERKIVAEQKMAEILNSPFYPCSRSVESI